jgi:DNA modification methylase
LKNDVIWNKTNGKPESVKNRLTLGHEYLFMLTKSNANYFNPEAILEPLAPSSIGRLRRGVSAIHKNVNGAPGQSPQGFGKPRLHVQDGGDEPDIPAGRRKRTVWNLSVSTYKGAHFATFPEGLVEPCILSASRPGDVVLDTFNGVATTGVVALKHGREYLGIELHPEYIEQSEKRILASLKEGRAVNPSFAF